MANGDGERIVRVNPLGTAGARVIVSPFQFYIDGADNLRLEGWNSLTGVVLQLFGRFYTESGEVKVFEWSLPLTADRLRNVVTFPAVRGYLLNLSLSVIGATPKVGQTFARCSIVRGLTGATIVVGTLLQGYCSSTQALGWPGSPIQQSHEVDGYMREYVGTQPAAGAAITEIVPTNAHWRVYTMFVSYLTDATAGNRRPYLQISAGAVGLYLLLRARTTIGPSVLSGLSLLELMPDTFFEDASFITIAYPHVELSADSRIVISTDLLPAGDQFFVAPRFMVQERLEV